MKLFSVPYRFSAHGEPFSMVVEAPTASEAACKLVRLLPKAIVWGYPVAS